MFKIWYIEIYWKLNELNMDNIVCKNKIYVICYNKNLCLWDNICKRLENKGKGNCKYFDMYFN